LVHNTNTIMSGLFDCAAYPCASDTHAPNGDYATRDDDVDYWKTQFSQVCPTIVSVRAPEPLELSWVDEAGNVLDTVESVDPLRMMGVNTAWTVSATFKPSATTVTHPVPAQKTTSSHPTTTQRAAFRSPGTSPQI
jgi:hypothetical protein